MTTDNRYSKGRSHREIMLKLEEEEEEDDGNNDKNNDNKYIRTKIRLR